MSETYADPTFESQLAVRVLDLGDVAVGSFDAAAIADRAMREGRPARPWSGLSRRHVVVDRRMVLLVAALGLALVLIAVAGRQHPHVVPPVGSRSMVTDGAWSPDGSRLAFVVEGVAGPVNDRAGYRDVYLADADGSDVHVLRQLAGADVGTRVIWSPDSRRIAVTEARPAKLGFPGYDGSQDVEVIDVDGRESALLTRDLPKGAELVGWSPDSERLLLNAWSAGLRADIYVARADGSDLTLLTSEHVDHAISWSPDGRWILYQHGMGLDAVADAGTWLMTPDGASRMRLNLPADGSTRWSPDGSRLITPVAGPDGTTTSVISGRVDGSDLRTIPTKGATWLWAHDGIRYAVAADDHSGWLVGDAAASETYLTHVSTDHDLAWSPDDSTISFVGAREGGTGVYVIDSTGGAERLIAPNAKTLGWLPSHGGEQRLAFVRDGAIGIVDAGGRHETTLVARADISERVDTPTEGIDDRMTITADGPDRDSYRVPFASRLAFIIENRSDRVWVVLADEGSISEAECHSTPSPSADTPANFANGCPIPPHSTVTFDAPLDVDGPVVVRIQPDISGPASTLQANTHRVIFDFVPATHAS